MLHEIALGMSIFLTIISQVILKFGAGKSVINITTLSAYALFFITSLFSVFALQEVALKTFIIWNSSTYVGVLLSGSLIFKEALSTSKIIGSLLICSGIVVSCF